MRLSPHFTLSELTKSQTAVRRGIRNVPNEAQVVNLKRLADEILEPVRTHYGRPFSPSSGFRCPELNAAVGSKPTSQHAKGEAVDFEVPGVTNLKLAEWIHMNIEFDQLILEFYDGQDPTSGWVHVSLKKEGNRKQVLTINHKGIWAGLNANSSPQARSS